VDSVEEGIEHALLFEPDILFVSNVRLMGEMAGVIEAASASILTVVSSPAPSEDICLASFKARFRPYSESFESLLKATVLVRPAADGKLIVDAITHA
jgi:hypothetical protein